MVVGRGDVFAIGLKQRPDGLIAHAKYRNAEAILTFILLFCCLSTIIRTSFAGFLLVGPAPWFSMFFLAIHSKRV